MKGLCAEHILSNLVIDTPHFKVQIQQVEGGSEGMKTSEKCKVLMQKEIRWKRKLNILLSVAQYIKEEEHLFLN